MNKQQTTRVEYIEDNDILKKLDDEVYKRQKHDKNFSRRKLLREITRERYGKSTRSV